MESPSKEPPSSAQGPCAICAWRATCQKRFSISGRDARCPDFCKDLTIGKPPAPEPKDK